MNTAKQLQGIVVLSAALLLHSQFAALAADTGGDWPMYRHDPHLTARSSGSGRLISPKVSWQYDLRGYRWWVVISAGGEAKPLSLSSEYASKSFDQNVLDAWGAGPRKVDLDGSGALQAAPPYAAKLLPGTPGFQTFDVHMVDSEKGRLELLAYNGGRHVVWQSEQFDVFQGPHPVIGDANADGQLDVVVCPHYQVAVLDGRTGKTIEQLKWHDGRNYGHFIVKNIDEDPALEMCVLGDFYTHMDMIDNDGANLKLLWRKEVELKIENKAKILRPRWDCLQDLDGDKRFELVVNLYNDSGDKQWRVMIYDALTGETKLDLPGLFMEGLEDVDSDGQVELFCTTMQALFTPRSAPLQIINYDRGKAVMRWTYPEGAWVTAQQPLPFYMNTLVADGDKNIVVSDLPAGQRCFYISGALAWTRSGANCRERFQG